MYSKACQNESSYPFLREPTICEDHHCVTDHGWCWECAIEAYGYDQAKLVYAGQMSVTQGKRKGKLILKGELR